MYMRYNLLTFNNYVGIVTDAVILKNLLGSSANILFLDEFNYSHRSDVGIWIQNYIPHLLENFKINVFFINEEWFDYPLEDLKRFDYVVCKSEYAYNMIKYKCNGVCLPFISQDFYRNQTLKSNSFLHFMGRSIQKNTELILNQSVPITLIDSDNRYKPGINFNHINVYQTTSQIGDLLNSHSTHICCSLYESWGHYLFEGLSTGAEIICSDIPVFKENLDPDLVHFIKTEEKIDNSYQYCNDNKKNLYPLRKAFFVNEFVFEDKLNNFTPIGKNQTRRNLYKHIMTKNTKKLVDFFNNL